MKILKLVLLIFILFTLLLTGIVIQFLYRIDLRLNPLAKYIYIYPEARSWGGRVSLVPKPFPLAASKEYVEALLKNSGFQRVAKSQIWQPLMVEYNSGKDIYSREGSRFPCNIKIFIFISWNSKNELQSAEISQEEFGCL